MRTLNNEMWGRMQPDTVVAQRYHRLRLPNMVAMGTRMSKDGKKTCQKTLSFEKSRPKEI